MFWNQPYPIGIFDIRRWDMIDLDVYGIRLTTADHLIGKSFIGGHVKQFGLYSKTEKLNLLLAISCDDANPMKWWDI